MEIAGVFLKMQTLLRTYWTFKVSDAGTSGGKPIPSVAIPGQKVFAMVFTPLEETYVVEPA